MAIAASIQPEFYSVFSPDKIEEIVHYLDTEKEIPFKFFYQGNMVKEWEEFNEAQEKARLSSAKTDDKFLKNVCIHLFQAESDCDRWNIVDIGAANPLLVKKLVGTFLDSDILNSYIALDISQGILDLSHSQLTEWFPNLNWQGHLWDFEKEIIPTIVAEKRQARTSEQINNLYLYIGGTFCNVKDRINVLKNIAERMLPSEWLCVSFGVDFIGAKNKEFEVETHISAAACRYVIELLGIDPNDVQIVGYFDEKWGGYKTDILFQQDYCFEFKLKNSQKIVQFNQGDRINIYRFFSYAIESDTSCPAIFEDFQKAGLEIISYRIEALLSRVMIVCQLIT
ncbi:MULTISPECIES: L-histidine N(alpha)-methyltransferase [Spirulina sp. CCY15215]|uniref:L-histidine N(alpha)-methyltransferase n=1 Tax=Spirulina sp. CCY15215 TaxID=2767591 RepID=UPI00194E56F4|nr:L-histidine N(alpha)-methyltransferase [Spirulina major]